MHFVVGFGLLGVGIGVIVKGCTENHDTIQEKNSQLAKEQNKDFVYKSHIDVAKNILK